MAELLDYEQDGKKYVESSEAAAQRSVERGCGGSPKPEFMWYLLETKGPSDEMVPQQINVFQSSRDSCIALAALQQKLEKSLWGRECLL